MKFPNFLNIKKENKWECVNPENHIDYLLDTFYEDCREDMPIDILELLESNFNSDFVNNNELIIKELKNKLKKYINNENIERDDEDERTRLFITFSKFIEYFEEYISKRELSEETKRLMKSLEYLKKIFAEINKK